MIYHSLSRIHNSRITRRLPNHSEIRVSFLFHSRLKFTFEAPAKLDPFKMPIFTLITNLPPNKVTPSVMAKASELIADLFGEKEKNVLVSMKAGVGMCWGPQPGTFALGTMQNTDPIQAEDTKQLAPAIFEFCEKELAIPQNRMYLGFITLNPENVAYGGETYSHNLND